MSFADLGPIAEFVFTIRTDAHVVHSRGREHAHVLLRHISLAILAIWHDNSLPSYNYTPLAGSQQDMDIKVRLCNHRSRVPERG